MSMFQDERQKVQFRHWTRPKFHSYNYIHNYRESYYNDIIDYLDKKQRGVANGKERQRPQTWAERALRTYTNKHLTGNLPSTSDFSYSYATLDSSYRKRDNQSSTSANQVVSRSSFHHSNEYYKRKYSSLLLN